MCAGIHLLPHATQGQLVPGGVAAVVLVRRPGACYLSGHALDLAGDFGGAQESASELGLSQASWALTPERDFPATDMWALCG